MVDALAMAPVDSSNKPVQGKYRDVVVMSGAKPKVLDLSQSHRGELRKNVRRQDFSIRDPEAGIAFKATTSTNPGGHHSPRHRHNFDQIRFVVEGEVTYGDRNYGAGWLGYFPEGVPYGPHGGAEHREVTLQFAGLSQSPFFTPDQTREGQRQIRDKGATFSAGICIWPDGRKQDGFEALYEFMTGRKVEYPPERYHEQVWINTNGFDWEPSQVPGVAVKRIVQFSARGPVITLIRLEPGATIPAGRTEAMMMRYVYEGAVDYKGEACPAVSGLYYPPMADYEKLHSGSGALVLSIELEGGGGRLSRLGKL